MTKPLRIGISGLGTVGGGSYAAAPVAKEVLHPLQKIDAEKQQEP